MYINEIGKIEDNFNDIKYLLSIVRYRRYYYDLDLGVEIYNNILKLLVNIFNYICKVYPNELYIARKELDGLEVTVDILELIVASPIQNLVTYNKLGMLYNVINLINNIDRLNPNDKYYIDHRLNKLYNWKIYDNKLKRDFCILFIASVYLSENINCYDAYIKIYNATLDKIFTDFYIDIPVMNIHEMRGNLNVEDIINQIWYMAINDQWNPRKPENHRRFYEFGAYDLWNDYQACLQDFYDGLASVAMSIIDEVMILIGPSISNIIIAYIKIKMSIFEDYVYSEYGSDPICSDIEIRTI